jgi:hypothetical protein
MRVSPNESQEAIEQAASEEWEMKVGFGTKSSSVSESNGSDSLKRIIEQADDEDAPPLLEEEEAVGLKEIADRPSSAVSDTRSGSVDDLRGLALDADVSPKTDFMAMWTVKLGNQVTQITAPLNAPVNEICDRAALDLGLGLKKWSAKVEQRGRQITVRCTQPETLTVQASIHLANQEWAGKVNRT